MADPITTLLDAVVQTGRIVAGVAPGQVGRTTPCADWDVRALLNHTVVGVQMFDAGARGEPFELANYGNDVLGEDPAAAYEAAAARFRNALAMPDVADRTWSLAFGDSPGVQAMSVATIELQQHGWDIARATDQDVAFDPALATAAREAAEALIGRYGRQDNVFKAAVECPDDATVEDRLAAFLGRAQ